MKHNWTPAQENAIKARNSNIIVSAAAGSGKTAVLVERVVKRILNAAENVNLDELLVVTFTNAAAAEMKTRISNALAKRLIEEPNNTHIIKQLSLVSSAQISTIDSFCINLVREHFFNLDIEQDFRILEESEAQILEQTVIEEIIERLYEEDNEEFKALVELLSTTKNDNELINSVRRIYAYSKAQPYPLLWLEKIGEIYSPDVDFDNSIIKDYIVEELRFYLSYFKDTLNAGKELLVFGDDMYEAYSLMLKNDEAIIDSMIASLSLGWDEMREVLLNSKFPSTVRKKTGFDADYIPLLQDKRKIYSYATSSINSKIKSLIAPSSEDIKNDNINLSTVFSSLIDLIKEFDSKLLEAKKEISAYTFSDIEHFAIQLLFVPKGDEYIRTELAVELLNRYKEILVDEYQDTNAAQDMLFKMLSNDRNRFMVGDVKQSIYRFRLAMPSIFNEKKETYSVYVENSKEVNQKIILDKNFRSREGICSFTNFLFSNLMSKKIGELDYKEEDYLVCNSEYPKTDVPSVQLNLVNTDDSYDKVEYEARQAAALIIKKVKSREQIKDDNGTRDIRYSDFAILLRSTKSSMPVYTKVFTEMGIPCVANNKVNLFENNEVSILVSLLRVIDNPVQDVPLLATLMSVFYGYTADEIANARVNCRVGNLYSAIAQDEEHFRRILDDIRRYGMYASSMSVEGLIRQIISETSYLSLISVMSNSEQRKLNVYKLIDLARRFDSGESVGLTAFIRYIDRICDSKLSVESAELSTGVQNAVSIMSVHKSKGLEFPIVILADSAHMYNREDERASLLLNDELGIGLKVNVEEGLYRYNSIQYEAVKTVNSNASMSENLRVLYVAVTRAKEQFIMFASDKCFEEHITSLSNKLTSGKIHPYNVKTAKCDSDLILLCSLLNEKCKSLRQFSSTYIEPDSRFNFDINVNIINDDISVEEPEKTVCAYDTALVNEIKEKLSFEYDRLSVSSYSAKRTASSLDDRDRSFANIAKAKPAFLSDVNMTAAQKGTAMHAFMQYCDYDNAKDDIEKEIERLNNNGYITDIQAESLNRESLNKLFSSDFAKRMFTSDKIYREIKVSSFVALNELEDTEYTDKVLVQGIADCVFEENGELVLVDYKTDYVKSEDELLDLYKRQIKFYKSAVAKTLQKPVKEALLYSFSLGKVCKYN